VLLPLNYRLAAPEWESILDHSSAVGIITESEFAGQIESLQRAHNGDYSDLWIMPTSLAKRIPLER
jgi:acyl-CoA synthetase (AMP-forming)/AMP-acid ligase II